MRYSPPSSTACLCGHVLPVEPATAQFLKQCFFLPKVIRQVEAKGLTEKSARILVEEGGRSSTGLGEARTHSACPSCKVGRESSCCCKIFYNIFSQNLCVLINWSGPFQRSALGLSWFPATSDWSRIKTGYPAVYFTHKIPLKQTEMLKSTTLTCQKMPSNTYEKRGDMRLKGLNRLKMFFVLWP